MADVCLKNNHFVSLIPSLSDILICCFFLGQAFIDATSLPEAGDEDGHSQGACAAACRVCACYGAVETDARLTLLGATAIEDLLQARRLLACLSYLYCAVLCLCLCCLSIICTVCAVM